MIDLATARRIAGAAFAAAAERDIRNISVVIADADGAVRLALRADAQGAFGIDTARAKARSALGFSMSTRRLAQLFAGNPAAVAGICGATGGSFMPIAGAVLVADAAGAVLGAASISGGNPAADDEIVRGAVASVGLTAPD